MARGRARARLLTTRPRSSGFLQGLLLPDNSELIAPGLALSFIAEAGLGLWLLFKGVKDVPEAHVRPDQ